MSTEPVEVTTIQPLKSGSDRDPKNLNPHLQVQWEDIIGEPEGLRTPDGCWNINQICYNAMKKCCYVFLVVLCGPIASCMTGCQIGCLVFEQVWCVIPCLKQCQISMVSTKKFVDACLHATCVPLFETCGTCLSKIGVRYQRLPEAEHFSFKGGRFYDIV